MKSTNVEFCPEKCITDNTVELEFHPPEDNRHDLNRQSACEYDDISDSDSENDVDEENTHQNDRNDFPLSRSVRKIKRPAKLKDYRSIIALAY